MYFIFIILHSFIFYFKLLTLQFLLFSFYFNFFFLSDGHKFIGYFQVSKKSYIPTYLQYTHPCTLSQGHRVHSNLYPPELRDTDPKEVSTISSTPLDISALFGLESEINVLVLH